MMGDDPPSSRGRGTTADKLGLRHEFEGASGHAESVTTFQQRRRWKHHQIPATGCFGMREDVLGVYLLPYPCRNVAET